MRTRAFPALVACITALAVIGAVRAHAQTPLETRLKAAIVSKFPQFVEWPAEAFSNRTTVDVCVFGGDAMIGDLRDLVAGVVVSGRPLAVRRIDRDEDVDRCHVLFVGRGALAAHGAALRRTASLPVLTVSDDPAFLDQGGIIQLREVNGRFRFDVNVAAAQRAGLRISAQLLQLALVVRDGPA